MLFLAVPVVLSGCYTTPVRHLTADIGMVKKGVSTEKDVLVYLGEPDKIEELGGGRQRWFYRQVEKRGLEKIPWTGDTLGTPTEIIAVIELKNRTVVDVSYSAKDPDETRWERD